MTKSRVGIEEFFLKIFKVTVLFVMGLSLVAVVFLLASAGYSYMQSPKEPLPARKAEKTEIDIELLKKFLIDQNKPDTENEEGVKEPLGERLKKDTALLYNEDALALYRCTVDFAKAINASVEEKDSQSSAQKVEDLRSRLEKLSGHRLRGDDYLKSAVAFTCRVLTDPSIVSLKKEGKIGTVFFPTLNFHLNAWDKVQADALEFEASEKERVAHERSAEEARVSTARALAVTQLIAAASAFGVFMLLALYLLGARVENHLRDISESIASNSRRDDMV